MAHYSSILAFLAMILSVGRVCSLPEQNVIKVYTCLEQKGPQNIDASETIHLRLKHPIYTYLHPNQQCEMRIQFKSSSSSSSRAHRWLVSVVNASMRAYSASAKFFNSIDESPTLAASVEPPLTSDTPQLDIYQFITEGSTFSVVFSTKKLPEAHSTGIVLRAEPFYRCPIGWFDTGISCYGMPLPTALVNKTDSEAACTRLGGGRLSQGVYIGDHIDGSIANLLALVGDRSNQSQQNFTYWVGISRTGGLTAGSDIGGKSYGSYDNGYRTPHQVILDYKCRAKADSINACNCVVYQSGEFLAENCNATHRYICMVPRSSSVFPITDDDTSLGCAKMVGSAWRSAAIMLILMFADHWLC